MTLEDLYCALSHGALANLAMADKPNSTIQEEDRPQVVLALNAGLARLYKRFVLKQKDVIIALQKDITFYHLRKEFAEQSYDPSSGNRPYILDLGREKFEEDVIKIMAVFNNMGRELPINDETQWASVFTPQAKTLQVPFPKVGAQLAVAYQAMHPKIACNQEGDVIDLPDTLHDALYAFIGYHVYTGIMSDGSMAAAAAHKGIYEELCGEIENRDTLAQTVTLANGRFDKGGWV